MTVTMVAKQTIDEIVAGLREYGLTDLYDEAGQMLTDENTASVHRQDSPGDSPPEPAIYVYKPVSVTFGQLARSITHYCYQACESPTWADSDARALCLRLSFALLDTIPGFQQGETR